MVRVGSVVPWVEPGVGAVATQSFTEEAHGPDGLGLLREGRTAAEALAQVLASDPGAAVRQVGMVDARGHAAAHTGAPASGSPRTSWATASPCRRT